MRPVLIVPVLLGLMGATAPAFAAPLNRGTATAPSQPPRTGTAPADGEGETPPAAGWTGAVQGGSSGGSQGRGSERRRNSYASCNRESHKGNLRGGARRRFLIRCKLGLERKQPSPQRSAEPGHAGKRP